MLIATIVTLCILAIVSGIVVGNRKKILGSNPRAGLSRPAQEALRWWDNMYDDQKEEDAVALLRALDSRVGVEAANRHFQVHSYMSYKWSYEASKNKHSILFTNYEFSWDSTDGCKHANCKFALYREMADAARKVVNANKEREEKFSIARMQPDIEALTNMTHRLRNEAEIVTEITKELL